MPSETLILDARGNPFQGSLDAIGGETFTDARVAGATLGALGADLVMDINGKGVAAFEIRATAMNATLVFEATIDGSNYYVVPAFIEATETMTAAVVIATTNAFKYVVSATGWRRVRCRVSVYTSGNCIVTGRASASDFAILARPIPSTMHQTSPAVAANTAATVTLPAAGVGLFHYITNIHLMRNATAVLLGSATLIHTTTNLPGNPAWSVGNAMIAGGTQLDLDYSPTTPLKSSASNIATTIVMPAAGLAVLNRGNVSYYVGA